MDIYVNSSDKIAYKNLKSDLIMKMLVIKGISFANYKANPVFDENETIYGSEIMSTYTYKTANENFKSQVQDLAMSTLVKKQQSNSKTLSLSLEGINNFYRNDKEGEQREAA